VSVEAAISRCCCIGIPPGECPDQFRECFGWPPPQHVTVTMSAQFEYNAEWSAVVDEEGTRCYYTNQILTSATISMTGTLGANDGSFGGFVDWPRYDLTGSATYNHFESYSDSCYASWSDAYSLSIPNMRGYVSCGRYYISCLPGWPGGQALTSGIRVSAYGTGTGPRTSCNSLSDPNCEQSTIVKEIVGDLRFAKCGLGPVPCLPSAFGGFGDSVPNTTGQVGTINNLLIPGFTLPPDENFPGARIWTGTYNLTFS
jgi:hypothetical protein